MSWELPAALMSFGVGLWLGLRERRAVQQAADEPTASTGGRPDTGGSLATADPEGEPASTGALADGRRARLLAYSHELSKTYESLSHPDDLLTIGVFQQAVAMLVAGECPLDDVFGYLVGDSSPLSCVAAAALGERSELRGRERELVPRLEGISIYARTFLLRAIARSGDPATAFEVLLLANGSWGSAMGMELLRGYLREHLDEAFVRRSESRARLAAVEEGQRNWLAGLLQPIDTAAARQVIELLHGRTAAGIDLAELRTFAQVLDDEACGPEPLPSATQDRAHEDVLRALRREPARSLLLVGPAGVGKATLTTRLVRELLADDWVVFVAGAAQLLAGQSYLGQIEQRVLGIVRAVGRRPKVLWIAPDLNEFLTAGRTMQSPTGLLDMIAPHLASGAIRLLAPLSPAAAELVLREAPVLRTAAVTVRLGEAPSEETLTMARAWLAANARGSRPLCDDAVLGELHQRALLHVADLARPGSLLSLLQLLRELVEAPGGDARQATLDDVITLLSRLTGLPKVVLDERDGLDLASVRRAFVARVMGQPEAVDCLIERIAMLKAGLCDPRRPIGVFLFTGPTGTGKTELCRALAAYLFGSEDRLLRLDMSEFQHADAIHRITGDRAGSGARALVDQVREQPFAVVLLDEIEKAHPLVFDLFLQVFDEGRLTDQRGRVADFRHTIVILTSNLGVKSLDGAGLGFGSGEPDLQKALEEVFRREFLNRIDRVVVFRPLDRQTLRAVLEKELDLALQRRGLKSRPWAVEWDESALQFLLQQGWSPTLGARPLRRAIERHVLAPLASAIVTDLTPDGDQFLFVRSNGRGVQVEFVDPDAEPATPAVGPASTVAVGLRALARDGVGRPDELAEIAAACADLAAHLRGDDWLGRKAAAYAAMGEADFWNSPRRHAVLSVAETMSRIETAVTNTGEQCVHLAREDHRQSAQVRRLAARVWLLQLAIAAVGQEEPQDAYLTVVPLHDAYADGGATAGFAAELLEMYRRWAALRGMEWQRLGEDPPLVAVRGFAAWSVLQQEAGLHVLDVEGARPGRVRVAVAGQPSTPASGAAELQLAREVLQPATASTAVVRRYRRDPSPEVKDRVRGWRSGRIDRVFGGEFDVIG